MHIKITIKIPLSSFQNFIIFCKWQSFSTKIIQPEDSQAEEN